MTRATDRRTFLHDGVLMTGGAAAGAVLLGTCRSALPAMTSKPSADENTIGRVEQRLRELGIELPPAPKPVAVYEPAVRVDNLLFVAGHIPRGADGKLVQGKVNQERTIQQGYDAARLVGISVLSTVRSALGSLDKVVRLVKATGMVNCTTDFTEQPQVVNGFSKLMVDVFGEKAGKGARSAMGVGSLPGNVPVEIEAVFEVRG